MRRFVLIIALSAALAACGQPSTTAAPGDAAAAQGGGADANAQADFVTRCTRDILAQNPQAQSWAPGQCEQNWQMVVAAGPMAEAILAAVPASGATDPASVRGRLTMVQWDARPEGALIASGRLGRDLSVQVDRNGPSLNIFWAEAGAMIPYDVLGALNVRGAEATMIGCLSYGMGESNKVYRIAAPGRAPFALSVYDRMAPTAEAQSFYNVGATLSGQVQTLAQLRRDGDEWTPTCG
jgi:hypothetical protein